MFKKVALIAAVLLPASMLYAQDPSQAPPAPGNTAPPALQKPYEALRDFFNFYALANAIYDTNGYYVAGSGTAGGSAGVQVGGGASGYHEWATGLLSLSYRGDYRGYFAKGYPNGNDQSLFLAFQKRFRRWTLDVDETGGILFNQGAVYGTAPEPVANPTTIVQSNPFSTDTRFSASSVSLSYFQSYRLSYVFTGAYELTRYKSGFSIGSNDLTGAFSTNYRVTKRATIGGTFSHGYYKYQRGNGDTNVDSAYFTVSYLLSEHTQVSASGGFSRSSGAGATVVPLIAILNGRPVSIEAIVHYQTTDYRPYYQGSFTKQMRHTNIIVSGGESVTPGNGIYLAARNIGINGLVIRELKRSNISFGGYYTRLGTLDRKSGSLGSSDTRGLDASYSYNLFRHMGVNARYDWLDFSSYGSYGGRSDNRFSAGIYIESKDVPLGLF